MTCQPGNDQWKIGVTSIFAHAVGIAPTKDNYRSTSVKQVPQNPKYGGAVEPYPRLQSAYVRRCPNVSATVWRGLLLGLMCLCVCVFVLCSVSSLSSGPVAVSDGVGYSDADLIMRACMDDGTLLQADTPAFALDATFLFRSGLGAGPDGELQASSSIVGGQRFANLLAVNLAADYKLPLTDLGYAASDQLVVMESNTSHVLSTVSGASMWLAPACGQYDFRLFHVAPLIAGRWAVIGETSKWVPVNNQRWQSLEVYGSSIAMTLRGAPGEFITITLWNAVKQEQYEVPCGFGESGFVRLVATTDSFSHSYGCT